MISNIAQEFDHIRQSVLQIQDCYARGSSMMEAVVQKIAALELLVPKIYLNDLCTLRQDLQVVQTSHLKAGYEQLVEKAMDTIENCFCLYYKNDFSSQNYSNDAETFQSVKSDDKEIEKDFFTDNLNPSAVQFSQSLFSPSNSQFSSDILLNKNMVHPALDKIQDSPTKNRCAARSKQQASLKVERGNYKITNEDDKARAIDIARQKGITAAVKETGFCAKNIKRWMALGPSRKKGGGRKILDPHMEERLHAWIVQQEREGGQLLGRKEVKNKAKEISTKRDFMASKGWLDKFRRRFNVKFRPSGIVYDSDSDKDDDSNYDASEADKENIMSAMPDESTIEEQPFKFEEQPYKFEEPTFKYEEPDHLFEGSNKRNAQFDKDMFFKNFEAQNFFIPNDPFDLRISLESDCFVKQEDKHP